MDYHNNPVQHRENTNGEKRAGVSLLLNVVIVIPVSHRTRTNTAKKALVEGGGLLLAITAVSAVDGTFRLVLVLIGREHDVLLVREDAETIRSLTVVEVVGGVIRGVTVVSGDWSFLVCVRLRFGSST